MQKEYTITFRLSNENSVDCHCCFSLTFDNLNDDKFMRKLIDTVIITLDKEHEKLAES